jgi:8-oxo-dGTP pyrophosphatase MutT (NUDIX family)
MKNIQTMYKKVFSFILIVGSLSCHAMAPQAPITLSTFPHAGASALPYTRWKPKNQGGKAYFLLSREVAGPDKGTYDAFGGKKDPNETVEKTASRELSEEAMGLLGNPQALASHISSHGQNTHAVVCNDKKRFAVYITKFAPKTLEHLTHNFYSTRQKLLHTPGIKHCLLEKDAIAWVSWQNLEQAIANAPRTHNGQGPLITPIKVWANVVDAQGNKSAQQINLRPVFVSTMQPFFKKAQAPVLRQGINPKVKFYTN